VKKVKQDKWEEAKQKTIRHFYACRKCWGKIELDKGIADWDQAKKQARADVAYHEEHECGSERTKNIAIYFSPNQGGHEHADINYANKISESELTLEQDNQGEIYQETTTGNDRSGGSWMPLIIGGIITTIMAGILVLGLTKKKSTKRIRRKSKR
jgi:hypothetical protein